MKRLTQMRQEKGFTLIELLIVITILGILAAVVVLSVSGINDKGKNAACNAEKQSVTTAEEAYAAKQTGSASYTGMQGLVNAGLLTSATTSYWTVATPSGTATAAAYTLSKVDSACP